MTEDEKIEAELDARVAEKRAADRAREREAVAAKLRQDAFEAHMKKINARHPVEDQYGGLGPEGFAARRKAMDERAAADFEHLRRINARTVPADLRARGVDQKGGSAGFSGGPVGSVSVDSYPADDEARDALDEQ